MCTIGRISTDEVFCLINSWNIIFQDIFYLCLKQRQLIHKAIIIKKKSVVVALARSISSKCILINDIRLLNVKISNILYKFWTSRVWRVCCELDSSSKSHISWICFSLFTSIIFLHLKTIQLIQVLQPIKKKSMAPAIAKISFNKCILMNNKDSDLKSLELLCC